MRAKRMLAGPQDAAQMHLGVPLRVLFATEYVAPLTGRIVRDDLTPQVVGVECVEELSSRFVGHQDLLRM